MKRIIDRRRFLGLSAGVAAAATIGGASQFLTTPTNTLAATTLDLRIWVTQTFPQTYTHIIPGGFTDPQRASQNAFDLFCYDRNASVGAFYATVVDGTLDDGTPVTNGLVKVGGDHTFNNHWTHITSFGADQLLFYDATVGLGAFYQTGSSGNLTLQRTDPTFRTSWSQIIGGQFGNANVLFYDAGAHTGQFYSVDASGHMQSTRIDTTWRSSWYSITKARFSGSGFDDLVFYDRGAGFGAFYKFNSSGAMIKVREYTGWRTTWKFIVDGDFGRLSGNPTDDGLLFYEDGTGLTQIYATDASGGLSQLPVNIPTEWISRPWQGIFGGTFTPNTGFGQLISYAPRDAAMVSSYLHVEV